MILHADQGFDGEVWDLDTAQRVRKVIWLDTERGLLEAYKWTEAGGYARDINGDYETYQARGRFRYVPRTAPNSKHKYILGAPRCAVCRRQLTLPGSDLCVFCNAQDKRHRMIGRPLATPELDCYCEHRQGGVTCGQLASWAVADEVEATPALAKGVLFGKSGSLLYDRAATVARHYYCARHYRPPRLLDAKGEVIEVFEDGCGLRPDDRAGQ